MATGQGTAIIDFGAAPGAYEASVVVTGQTLISATSKVEIFVMADDSTSDHTAEDHRWLHAFTGVGFTGGTPTAGDGFPIYGKCIYPLEGQWALRFVWAD